MTVRRFLVNDLCFDPFSEGQNVLPGERKYGHLKALGGHRILGVWKSTRAISGKESCVGGSDAAGDCPPQF